MKKILLFALVSLAFLGCKKDEEEEDNPASPVLTFVSISSNEAVSYNNDLKVIFSYEDFQGDIGEEDPDNLTLWVKDARLDAADYYHVPPMTPENQELHIKGNYEVSLNTLFLLGNGAAETTKFTIQLRDRAGNVSNIIETTPVTITP